MLDDFIVRAALAALGVALAAAPLGCFVIWRRMAYFGDATSHAAILGVALGLALSLPIFPMVLLVALAAALLVTALSNRGYAIDTALGVLAHSALAFGLVAIALIDGIRVDLDAFLFGDLLTVTRRDLVVVWLGAALIVGLLWWRWSALLIATLGNDLAEASGVNPRREQLVLTLLLALTVAVSLKVIGALLIGALLIIPAATARPLARTPERMAILAALTAIAAGLGGLWISYIIDTPTGPTIVATAAILFGLSLAATSLRRS